MLPASAVRVAAHTAPAVNERIRLRTEDNVRRYAQRPELIAERLVQLDREWDTERALETMSSVVTLAGLYLTVRKSRKFLFLPLVVQGFFLQHALQGWCPPLPVLRRLGFRTRGEIERERTALKALRGDFRGGGGLGARAEDLVDAAIR